MLKLMKQAFRTTESCGPEKRYAMVFKFKSLADLDAADDEWRAAQAEIAALKAALEKVANFDVWEHSDREVVRLMKLEAGAAIAQAVQPAKQNPVWCEDCGWSGADCAGPADGDSECPECGASPVFFREAIAQAVQA